MPKAKKIRRHIPSPRPHYIGTQTAKVTEPVEAEIKKAKGFWKRLGPGLVTGAADDDPSGIGTYSQAGAAFGFQLAWLLPFTLPLMIIMQEMSGRVGLVTGKGLAQVIKEHYSRWILYGAVFLLIFANTVNIGADIGAMAASAQLFVPIPFVWLTMFFTLGIVTLQLIVPYKRYAKILKWLCLSLLAYVITTFIVQIPWHEVLYNLTHPTFLLDSAYIMTAVAVLGTTISPYLFFWEASQEVEEEIVHKWTRVKSEIVDMSVGKIRRFRQDNAFGMIVSNIVALFILITAAATLHKSGITNIATADQAARALEPLVHGFPHAGKVAQAIFAIGIIGTGLLAIPTLAGSAGYALSEAVGINEGLSRKVKRARGFYGVIVGATLMGLLINFVGIPPIKALFYSAVINGVLAVPLIFIIIRVANNPKVMGQYRNRWLANTLGWITFAAMFGSVIAMAVVH